MANGGSKSESKESVTEKVRARYLDIGLHVHVHFTTHEEKETFFAKAKKKRVAIY